LLFFGQACTFLDNSVAALQDHLFDRAKWLQATAMPKQKKHHSRTEIARRLAQANRLARQGKLQSEIARTLGVSAMTLHRWRRALLRARPAHETDQRDPTRSGDQIAQLQLENSLLRRLVTDLLLLEKVKRRHQRPS
jgi:putative transposase